MVLTVSTGLCAWPRLWQRLVRLMLTCRNTYFWGKRAVFVTHPNISPGWTFQTREEGKPTLPHLKVVGKRMPKYLWPRHNPQLLSEPSIVQVLWVNTGTHSYKVKRLFRGMLNFQRCETAPSSLNRYLLYWLNRRPVALVYECDLRLTWLHVAVAYSAFPEVCPVPFHPDFSWPCDLRAPVWCSSCPSHCFPGQRCPVRR